MRERCEGRYPDVNLNKMAGPKVVSRCREIRILQDKTNNGRPSVLTAVKSEDVPVRLQQCPNKNLRMNTAGITLNTKHTEKCHLQ